MTISEQECEGLLRIDLGAVASNYRTLRSRLADSSRCGAVVKADAYGLGIEQVAPALYRAGCREFFVATLAEGRQLRAVLESVSAGEFESAANPGAAREAVHIYLLTGLRPGCEAECAAEGLIPVLVSVGQMRRWCQATADTHGIAAPCALKVDTGMTRLGMTVVEFHQLLQDEQLLAGANVQLFLSHLACADEAAHPQNRQQLDLFKDLLAKLRSLHPRVRASFANSSGIYLGEEYHFDLVRPGSALYGINPTPAATNPMSAVVNLRLPVLQQREIFADSAVGYGATEMVAAGSWLAVVRGGYADGILRAQSGRGRGCAVIGDRRVEVPMIGRVSMDTSVFDISVLTAEQRARLEIIEVLNESLTVDQMGVAADTIGYEILTSLGRRYCRIYR
ncbi:alanine racemase [Microbulbifer agarilyticus]|uniref:alanine racemase n=1 Tax=Microbulbifer agarilyticus TaxID=260552 RepID=UPI001C93C446|nr:alanine racemase [Microbulbifer agarilyticus]MBY6191734.1 alanine racemase [Microbulbifer agarilyticus]